MPKNSLDSLQEYFADHRESILNDFKAFLSFPSISTDKHYQKDCLECANWVENFLNNLGFHTEQWPTSDHPVIYGEWLKAGPNQPTVLLYHHYDVQPVDPLELWENPPFAPIIKDGQIYARGAQDNKGQCFYTLSSIKALLDLTGTLPVNVKFCIEGGEECGSHGLDGILAKYSSQLKADYLVIVDVGIPSEKTPSVTLGTRGLITMDLEVKGSNIDLHSGAHGGIVYNPLRAIAEILGKIFDENGKIAIPGFYDDVVAVSQEDRKKFAIEFDAEQYEKFFHTQSTGGEKQFTPLERNWMRPSFEINGIHGGYGGEGFKTVIPAKAAAKISCRLVPDQDPQKIGQLVQSYLESLAPQGVEVTVKVHLGSGRAVRVSTDSKIVEAFAKSFSEVFQKPCKFILEGASIPITPKLSATSQAETVLVGLGLVSDQIHAPNEHFGLDRFEKGFLIVARALAALPNL